MKMEEDKFDLAHQTTLQFVTNCCLIMAYMAI